MGNFLSIMTLLGIIANPVFFLDSVHRINTRCLAGSIRLMGSVKAYEVEAGK
jgi:hypothetical protein